MRGKLILLGTQEQRKGQGKLAPLSAVGRNRGDALWVAFSGRRGCSIRIIKPSVAGASEGRQEGASRPEVKALLGQRLVDARAIRELGLSLKCPGLRNGGVGQGGCETTCTCIQTHMYKHQHEHSAMVRFVGAKTSHWQKAKTHMEGKRRNLPHHNYLTNASC